ncbi:MAG: ABC transporter ATP-binding protein [Sphingobacteriales bacterium]|nr:ABC transporter ATP-binding protein [Sphingobacteriales bacterium]MBI3720629.1 ABC transporter ATP-binding protein [Sphingobacteriales bacterium]
MTAIVSVNHLSKHFRDLKAVDDLSFSVNEGDIYGFLGQNGAGKSTTIRMLLTLIEPTDGDIEIMGMNLKTHRKEILRNVGAVIEKPDLYKYLTAQENLSLFAKISGVKVPSHKIKEQLELVGLIDRADSKIKTFSQGMKQRLGIAVALIHDPKLIILDEPVNGLDPQGIADIRNLILQLSRSMGKTVIVSSHLLNEIEIIANRVLIIDRGKKIQEGTATELFDPVNTLVELIVADVASTWEKLQQTPWNNNLYAKEGDTILLRMHRNDIPSLFKTLSSIDVQVYSLSPRHSLEDYFLSITTQNRHVETFAN